MARLWLALLCLCAVNEAWAGRGARRAAERSLRLEAFPPRPSLLLRGAEQLKAAHVEGLDRGVAAAPAPAAAAPAGLEGDPGAAGAGASGSEGADGGSSTGGGNASGAAVLSLPAPGQVREDFVRRCTVALSVRSRQLLPVDVLEEFCRSTNAIVECKQQLVTKLKAVHAERGSIPAFCSDAYSWFQKKYGMLCPMQCEKLQCRATCLWLEEKKRLGEESKQLKGYDMEVMLAEDALDDAVAAVAKARRNITLSARALNQSIIVINRTQARLTEQQGVVELARDKAGNATATIVSLEDVRHNFTHDLQAHYAELQNLTFQRDQAVLTDQLQKKQVERLTEDIREQVARWEQMQPQITRNNRSLQERRQGMQALENSTLSLGNISEAQASKVLDANASLQRAESMLANAEAGGNISDSERALMRDLQKQQRANLSSEELLLEKVLRHRRFLEAELNRSSAEFDVLNSEFQDLVNKSRVKADQISGLVAELREAEAAARALGNGTLAALRGQLRSVREAIGHAAGEYITVNRTLAAARENAAEDTRDFEQQHAREQTLFQALTQAQVQKLSAEQSLQQAEEALQQANATESALRIRFENMSADSNARKQASREAQRRLNRAAPDIVWQHGLRLLEVVATW